MKRCKRCVMPEKVYGITFNQDGICNFCLNYKKEKYLGEEELRRIIASIMKGNNEYDCIVPLSGGRDSTFVLYTAKVVYDLKVLAVSYDNEFRTDQALFNMKNACKLLNVDFVSVRSKRNVAQKIVLYSIRSALPHGMYVIAGSFCSGCSYGYRSVVYRAAEKYKVPLIIWGESQNEITTDMRIKPTEGIRRSKFRRLLNINAYKAEYYKLLQRLEFRVSGNSILSRGSPILKEKGIKEIRLFDYISWDRKKIKETIMKELGWEKPRGRVSSWRIDCMLHNLMNYCFFNHFGCSKDCFGYCNMINSEQMNRAEALKQEEEMATTFAENIRELQENKIGLSKKEVAKIESFQAELEKKL